MEQWAALPTESATETVVAPVEVAVTERIASEIVALATAGALLVAVKLPV